MPVPALFYLEMKAFNAASEWSFATTALALCLAVVVAGLGGSEVLRRLLPDRDLRAELRLLVHVGQVALAAGLTAFALQGVARSTRGAWLSRLRFRSKRLTSCAPGTVPSLVPSSSAGIQWPLQARRGRIRHDARWSPAPFPTLPWTGARTRRQAAPGSSSSISINRTERVHRGSAALRRRAIAGPRLLVGLAERRDRGRPVDKPGNRLCAPPDDLRDR